MFTYGISKSSRDSSDSQGRSRRDMARTSHDYNNMVSGGSLLLEQSQISQTLIRSGTRIWKRKLELDAENGPMENS